MYKRYAAYGTTVHTFEFDPESYSWTIEIGKSGQLETLSQIAADADYTINWSVFDWNTGKDGYGRIQNGDKILQPSGPDFPTVSFVNGKLQEGEFSEAYPGFPRWRVVARNGKAIVDYVAGGNHNIKDARSAVGQKENGNIVFITVEGDDTKKRGMTCKELGEFAVSLGCVFACDCDGGGSTACRSYEGYIYNQGRAIAGAMVLRRKILKYNFAWRYALTPLDHTKVNSIAIHHMAHETAGLDDIHRWHLERDNGTWAGFGYNYWIAFDGKIYEGRGLNQGAGVAGENDHIISIGLQGHFDIQKPTEVQLYALAWLIYQLKQKIPTIKIVDGHKAWDSTSCPGKNFSIEKFQERSINMGHWEDEAVKFVKKFQQATGLVADGKAGAQTNSKLDEILKNQGGDAKKIKDAWNKFLEAIK